MTTTGLCAVPDCGASVTVRSFCDAHARDLFAPSTTPRPVLHCTCPEGTQTRRTLGGGTECGVCRRAVLREVA